MKKRLFAVGLAVSMLFGLLPVSYAATGSEVLSQIKGIEVKVPTDIKLCNEGDSLKNGAVSIYIDDAAATTFNFRAEIGMKKVLDAVEGYESILESYEGSPDKKADIKANSYVKDGEFKITIKYPTANFTIPASAWEDDSMKGFSYKSDSDLDYKKVFYEKSPREYTPGNIVIKIGVNPNNDKSLTIDNLKSWLKDLYLTYNGIKVSALGKYKVIGEIEGWTDVVYGDSSFRINYVFEQGGVSEKDINNYPMEMKADTEAAGKEICGTIIVKEKSTGGGGGSIVTQTDKKLTVVVGKGHNNIVNKYPTGTAVELDDITLPEVEGYEFDGFYNDAEFTSPADNEQILSKDKTVYVKWKDLSDTPEIIIVIDEEFEDIEFDIEGGEIYPKDVKIPPRVGYDFGGLYFDEDFLIPWEEDTPIKESTKLYTKWIEKEVVSPFDKDNHIAYIIGYPTDDGSDIVMPTGNMTREEISTAYYRLLSEATRTALLTDENDFPDVAKDRWSNKAVSSMAKGGYVKGYEDGTFRPGNKVTRAEFVTVTARFWDVSEDTLVPASDFSDIDNHWAKTYVNYAFAEGWIDGYEDGTFRPDAYITRAEVMKIINKMLERCVDEEGIAEGAIRWDDNAPDAWYYYEVIEATNAHDFVRGDDTLIEDWTNLKENNVWLAKPTEEDAD